MTRLTLRLSQRHLDAIDSIMRDDDSYPPGDRHRRDANRRNPARSYPGPARPPDRPRQRRRPPTARCRPAQARRRGGGPDRRAQETAVGTASGSPLFGATSPTRSRRSSASGIPASSPRQPPEPRGPDPPKPPAVPGSPTRRFNVADAHRPRHVLSQHRFVANRVTPRRSRTRLESPRTTASGWLFPAKRAPSGAQAPYTHSALPNTKLLPRAPTAPRMRAISQTGRSLSSRVRRRDLRPGTRFPRLPNLGSWPQRP